MSVKHSVVLTRLKIVFARFAAGTLLLGLSATAMSGTANLSWTAPTQNTDGSPLTDLAEYRIYQGCQQSGTYELPPITGIPGTVTSITSSALPEGVDCYFVATAVNSVGTESAYSNEATRIINAPAPAPPTNLIASGNLVAYTPSMTADRFVLIPVGTVAAGTPCDGNQSANGKYLIPRDSIQWQIAGRPAVVFTDCTPG